MQENQHSACPNLSTSATTTTTSTATTTTAGGKLANEVAKARQHIKKSLQCVSTFPHSSFNPNYCFVIA